MVWKQRRQQQAASGRILGMGAVLLFLAGCGLPQVYRPQEIGTVPGVGDRTPYRVEIKAEQSRVRLGEPITFCVRVLNTGSETVWMPREPQIVMAWIYANGNRDNVVKDVSTAMHQDAGASRLEPGEEVSWTTQVRTNAFPWTGVTEFRAVLTIPRNTNPALDPFPHGRFASNGYGVMVR